MFEATISYVTVNEKGDDKAVKERFICENSSSFSDVEAMLYEMYGDLTDFEVVAIKRSKLKEVANKRENENQNVFVATLTDVFLQDDGSEKEMQYSIAFFSENMDTAHTFIKEYSKQGYNMSIDGIKKTSFEEVL